MQNIRNKLISYQILQARELCDIIAHSGEQISMQHQRTQCGRQRGGSFRNHLLQ